MDYREQWEEERRRRRKLNADVSAKQEKILLLEARLALAERPASPRKATLADQQQQREEEQLPSSGADDSIDPIEESIRLMIARNTYLEEKVKKYEERQDFEKEYLLCRKMLSVQEEIETTLTKEINRLRSVVKAQRHALQRLVTEASSRSSLESDEFNLLRDVDNSYDWGALERARETERTQLKRTARPQTPQQSPTRSRSPTHTRASGLRNSHALRQYAAMTAVNTFAKPSSSPAQSPAKKITHTTSTADEGQLSPYGDVFCDITDNDGEEEALTLPQQSQRSSPTRSSPSVPRSSPQRAVGANPRIASAPSETRAWTPTRGKEVIPNIVDHGILNMHPATVDPNYERRLHAAAVAAAEIAEVAGFSSTPTQIARVPSLLASTQIISPGKMPPSPVRSNGRSQTAVRPSPSASSVSRSASVDGLASPSRSHSHSHSRSQASNISQALQKEVDSILLQIEASLKE